MIPYYSLHFTLTSLHFCLTFYASGGMYIAYYNIKISLLDNILTELLYIYMTPSLANLPPSSYYL